MATVRLIEEAKDFLIQTRSTQVKMFIHSDPKDAEKGISQWMKQHDVIIQHITQSQSEKNGSFVFVLTVFYQEGELEN